MNHLKSLLQTKFGESFDGKRICFRDFLLDIGGDLCSVDGVVEFINKKAVVEVDLLAVWCSGDDRWWIGVGPEMVGCAKDKLEVDVGFFSYVTKLGGSHG